MITRSMNKFKNKKSDILNYKSITNIEGIFLMLYPYYQVKSKYLLMDSRYYDVKDVISDIIDEIINDLEIDKTTGIPIASFLNVGKFLYENNY